MAMAQGRELHSTVGADAKKTCGRMSYVYPGTRQAQGNLVQIRNHFRVLKTLAPRSSRTSTSAAVEVCADLVMPDVGAGGHGLSNSLPEDCFFVFL